MRSIDKARESRRIAETASRGEQPDRLVAPEFVERMFADRQKLDVGVTHIDDIRDELIGRVRHR